MNEPIKGALLASLVAGLIGCGSSPPPEPTAPAAAPSGATEASVKCSGVNACGKQGACKGADHECKGQNKCKGQGISMTATAEDCTSKGGKVM
jgi:hypothetical protein